MNTNELINAIMPYIISAAATILASIGAYLGSKIKEILDTKQKRDIVEATVKYVDQVANSMGLTSKEKKELAIQKALEWVKTKGINISEIELDILIEAFVNDFSKNYKVEPKAEVVTTHDIVEEIIQPEVTE